MTVAGFLGSARQWRVAEKRLKQLKRLEKYSLFHATHFKQRGGEFAGWSNEKGMRLIETFAQLMREELTGGVTVSLPYQLYANSYKDTPFPKKVPRYSQYGLCIYMLLDRFIDLVRNDQGKHVLHLVVEQGHRNEGAAATVFKDTKEFHRLRGIALLGDVTLANKRESELLAIADFHAHASGISDTWERTGRQDRISMPARPLRRDEAAIDQINCTAETLQRIKDRFVWMRDEKHAAYFREKAEYVAAQRRNWPLSIPEK